MGSQVSRTLTPANGCKRPNVTIGLCVRFRWGSGAKTAAQPGTADGIELLRKSGTPSRRVCLGLPVGPSSAPNAVALDVLRNTACLLLTPTFHPFRTEHTVHVPTGTSWNRTSAACQVRTHNNGSSPSSCGA